MKDPKQVNQKRKLQAATDKVKTVPATDKIKADVKVDKKVEVSKNSDPVKKANKNPSMEAIFQSKCPKGRFYNKFKGMNATFLIPGSSTTITDEPKLKYNISPDKSQIVVTIPAD